METAPNLYDKYINLSDDELLSLIKNDDNTALEYIIEKYKKLVKIKAKPYFIIGSDKEDIIQEGMIGLYKAIRDYSTDKNNSFCSFAALCINRQIITAIKAAGRQKHIPLNSYLSLNREINNNENEATYMEMLCADRISNPEALIIDKEEVRFIESNIESALSKLECRVLSLYLNGRSYAEIAKIINKDEKAIDNALQRVKKKLEKVIMSRKAY